MWFCFIYMCHSKIVHSIVSWLWGCHWLICCHKMWFCDTHRMAKSRNMRGLRRYLPWFYVSEVHKAKVLNLWAKSNCAFQCWNSFLVTEISRASPESMLQKKELWFIIIYVSTYFYIHSYSMFFSPSQRSSRSSPRKLGHLQWIGLPPGGAGCRGTGAPGGAGRWRKQND